MPRPLREMGICRGIKPLLQDRQHKTDDTKVVSINRDSYNGNSLRAPACNQEWHSVAMYGYHEPLAPRFHGPQQKGYSNRPP